jgi:two-component system phosphate regulon sensor histidine kinase PhoR
MKRSITTYIVIALVSFLILTLVQFYLVYNTYELKNERYYYAEKEALLKEYSASVMTDILFEGGKGIFDSVLGTHTARLRALYKTDRAAFDRLKQAVADSLFALLAARQNIPALLSRFKKAHKIHDSLEYSLMIEMLEIHIGDNIKVMLYNKTPEDPLGIRIGGNLQQMDNQNRIVHLTIGPASEQVSKFIYGLYVQPVNRQQTIFGQMALTLVLSVLSVLSVVLLFFYTFRNWIRQKKLSEMKSDFINNITHEFHTPLSAILVANKSLQNEKIVEKKENIRPLTEVIQRQSERLQTLIGQVLDIVSAKKMVLNKKEYSVNSLLDEILLDYRLNVTDKQVNLVFDEKAVTDSVQLDPFHFTTMMINMLDNAVKYNNHELKEIRVSTKVDKNSLQVTISDNGMGMKPETQKHIFGKFYRGVNGTPYPTQGLGLGLYYVRQSVEAHQWQIQVESSYGQGSQFTIVIPFQNEAV